MEKHEIITDGRTVWINSHEGICLGRFSWAGIDVHKTYDEQLAECGQCYDCKPGPTTLVDWEQFQRSMLNYHHIDVTDKFMPKFLQAKGEHSASDQQG